MARGTDSTIQKRDRGAERHGTLTFPTRGRAAARLRGCLAGGLLALAGPAPAAPFDGDYQLLEAGRSQRVGSLEFRECRLSGLGGHVHQIAECATFSVPEDPADLTSPPLELFVVRLASTSARPAPDPLVAIAGGPGQAASLGFLGSRALAEARETRHVYLMDQRGTGFSTPLNCANPGLSAEGSPATAAQAARDCLAALERDPRHFSTSQAVRDLEALRLALAAPALNLLGVSYGTRVAQHYVRRYRATSRSLILDGVVPMDLVLGPDIALVSQAALDRVVARCEAEPACATAFPELRREVSAVLAGVEGAPLARTAIASTVQMALYQGAGLSLLPVILHAAAEGDYGPLAAQYQRLAQAQLQGLNFAMANSVICSEDIARINWSLMDWAALDATFLGGRQLKLLRAVCEQWPRSWVDLDLHTPLKADLPALLLSGEFDPVTPPYYARHVASHLPQAQLLEVAGQAHNTLDAGCVPELIASFLERPTRPLERECLARVWQIPFFLSPNGPGP